MPASVIVENLSKEYRIGELHRATTLREALVNVARRPFRRRRHKPESIWAVKDVSFQLQQGEVLGILGRNGAGKSTLLKLISRITYPTSGRTRTFGRVGSLLEVGTGFHEELTGKENIYLNGAILGMRKKEIDAKLEAIVDFSGVSKFIDTPIKRYSSGMRLRLGFAVAAHLDPDVLLVDEVLAVGDVEFQRKCLKAMDDMHSGGRTVMFVSHNLAAVENLCQRAIWIDNGQVRMDGSPAEVIREYLSSFAKADDAGCRLGGLERRGCSEQVRFTDVQWFDEDGAPKDVIRTGERLTMRLGYEVRQRVRHPHFGVKVYTDAGTMVTSMSTWMVGCDIPALEPGKGHLDLEIDGLNLMTGRYYVSLWIATVGGIIHDRLDHCTFLDVEPSDFYKAGRKLDKTFGLMLMPCRWKANSNGSAV